MKKYLLAIDQGTTGTRSIIFDEDGQILAQVSRRHEQIYPASYRVEHNAEEIFFNAVETMKQAIASAAVPEEEIVIGITNQRETVVAWNKVTGETAGNAIVWQDKRTTEFCRQICADGFEPTIRQKTGLIADPYFSASKMNWILENNPTAQKWSDKGELVFGTMDSFLIFKLTGGERFVTDFTNASRTMLFNISDLDWDAELLEYFGVPRNTLPQVVPSSGFVGYTRKDLLGACVPIAGVAGDQHAALFGQGCFDAGEAKNTYGTGCFILQNIGNHLPLEPFDGLLTTIAWNINGETVYAAEGSILSAGAAIEWLVNSAKMVSNIDELNLILSTTLDAGDVVFVPAFSGLGAPVWNASARAAFTGIDLSTRREHLVRAVCESIAFLGADVIHYMEEKTNIEIPTVSVDGGVSNNDILMQFQADILNKKILRPANTETTALGAAALAGLAVGVFKDTSALKRLKGTETTFWPRFDEARRLEYSTKWNKALKHF